MARGVTLKSLADVRRFMAKIINQLHKGEIEESKGRTLAYMSSILKDIVKESDFEQRMAEIEKRLKDQNGKF